MSKEMNCVFKYKEGVFNIKVQLHFINERGIGGKSLHRITINDMGPRNWGQVVDSDKLLETINLSKSFAINYFDKSDNKTAEERLLLGLGFD